MGTVSKRYAARFSPTGCRNSAEVLELFSDTVEWMDEMAREGGYDISWDTVRIETDVDFSFTFTGEETDYVHVTLDAIGFKEVQVYGGHNDQGSP